MLGRLEAVGEGCEGDVVVAAEVACIAGVRIERFEAVEGEVEASMQLQPTPQPRTPLPQRLSVPPQLLLPSAIDCG